MSRFGFVSYGLLEYKIVYDIETKVEYYMSKGGVLTLLVDAEGKPLLYKGRGKNG